jgi:hypothetical protein
LFAKIERFLLPVNIHLANGKIAAPWKSIDQYAMHLGEDSGEDHGDG